MGGFWEHSQERWQEKSNIMYSLITRLMVETLITKDTRRGHIASSDDQGCINTVSEDPGKTALWWTLIQKGDMTKGCDLMGISRGKGGMQQGLFVQALLIVSVWHFFFPVTWKPLMKCETWKGESFPAFVIYLASFSLNCNPLKCSVFGLSSSDLGRTKT